jgi:hypothetical protein
MAKTLRLGRHFAVELLGFVLPLARTYWADQPFLSSLLSTLCITIPYTTT